MLCTWAAISHWISIAPDNGGNMKTIKHYGQVERYFFMYPWYHGKWKRALYEARKRKGGTT